MVSFTSYGLLALATATSCNAFTPGHAFTTSVSRNGVKPFSRVMSPSPVSSSSILKASSLDDGKEGTVFEPLFDGLTDVLTLALRVGTCSLMIHHGFDKIQNVDGFSANVVAKFFGFLPGDPHFWTLSAAATQIAGAGLLSVGILARPVALSMMATMMAAVVFHLLNTGLEGYPLAVIPAHSYNFELAAMYVLVLAYFGVNGAGAYSIDEKVLGGELELYEGVLGSVFGGSDKTEE
mmetsp:Transcript_17013/g.33887  ORF Transcript_17013/g.33887 Transcript_17013/m.33887 type:complete len:236 (-) Transcript_17013:317-1024(-)